MEWIPVAEELPTEDQLVDVYLKSTQNPEYGERQVDIIFDGEKFRLKTRVLSYVYVSHWMPLPSWPKAG